VESDDAEHALGRQRAHDGGEDFRPAGGVEAIVHSVGRMARTAAAKSGLSAGATTCVAPSLLRQAAPRRMWLYYDDGPATLDRRAHHRDRPTPRDQYEERCGGQPHQSPPPLVWLRSRAARRFEGGCRSVQLQDVAP